MFDNSAMIDSAMKPLPAKRRLCVAVIGDGQIEVGDAREAIAESLGRGIVDAGHRLLTGGKGGVMAAASRGARTSAAWQEGGGCIIGLLPGVDVADGNDYLDIVIATGLGHGRNQLVAQSAAVIAVGGGAGTLSEMAYAWMYNRLIIAVRCGGWSEKLAGARIDERVRYPDIAEDRVYGARDAAHALELLADYLPRYVGRDR